MKALYLGLAFSLGVFMALLAAFVGTGGTNGAAAVLLGAWGAFWLMLAGGMLVARYNASDAVDHFDYPPPTRHLRPPVQYDVLTIWHEPGQSADLATTAPTVTRQATSAGNERRFREFRVVGEVAHDE